jgi:aspartyl-tRNA(Asn)/glutamyl-tRNA(Gln) amidotransferase subunit B
MEKGQMRVDVNISVRKHETDPLGTRVEYKNINSFRAIGRAITYEYELQSSALASNTPWDQCTKRRDDLAGTATILRSKENALDYRYQPEPDLPPLILDDTIIDRHKDNLIDLHHIIILMRDTR